MPDRITAGRSGTTTAPVASTQVTGPYVALLISNRYDYRRSTCITTNRLFKDWPKVFPDALNAEVIAKRLTERAEHFVLDGKGYRSTKSGLIALLCQSSTSAGDSRYRVA